MPAFFLPKRNGTGNVVITRGADDSGNA